MLGDVFNHDLRSTGVAFDTRAALEGPPTGRCLILVTPDAQRTMNTYLGASVHLSPGDVDAALIARGRILFLEGYLFDLPNAREAFRVAARMAHAAEKKVALTICDPFCVDRHRVEFRDLVTNHVDILFANEAEICSLYEVADFDTALQHVRGECEIAVLTRGKRGSLIIAGDEFHVIDAHPVEALVDTTGAETSTRLGCCTDSASGSILRTAAGSAHSRPPRSSPTSAHARPFRSPSSRAQRSSDPASIVPSRAGRSANPSPSWRKVVPYRVSESHSVSSPTNASVVTGISP